MQRLSAQVKYRTLPGETVQTARGYLVGSERHHQGGPVISFTNEESDT